MNDLNKEALTYAFNLLSISDRSEKILHEKISKRFDQASADKILEYLSENNFINDKRYAKNLIENYLSVRSYGRNRIRLELMKKKIPQEIISQELENVSGEEDGCREATENWLRKKNISGEMEYAAKNKLLAYLIRRGFDYDTAKSSVEQALKDLK